MEHNYFTQFLNFYWLRPENAVLQTIRASHYRRALDKHLNSPDLAMDASCGDGVFSFFASGGELAQKDDMFQDINMGFKKRTGNFDAFDQFTGQYSIEIEKKPSFNIGYGLDLKNNLLQKASQLKLYNHLIQHDSNKPLSFESDSFDLIYMNSPEHIKNIDTHLAELSRTLKPDGTLLIGFKTLGIERFKSPNYMPFMNDNFHSIIDAGRMSSWPSLMSYNDMVSNLEKLDNLELIFIEPIYGNIIGQMWDIGLRPLFRPLVAMANNLSSTERVSVKNEWCGILHELLSEFVDNYKTTMSDAFEFMAILKKKS